MKLIADGNPQELVGIKIGRGNRALLDSWRFKRPVKLAFAKDETPTFYVVLDVITKNETLNCLVQRLKQANNV